MANGIIVIEESTDLHECEAEGRRSMISFGAALERISQQKLYKQDGFSSFDAYLKVRWGFPKQRANQITDACKTRRQLIALESAKYPAEKSKVPIPHVENHLMALRKYAESTEELVRLWDAICERVLLGAKLTANLIEKIASEIWPDRAEERRLKKQAAAIKKKEDEARAAQAEVANQAAVQTAEVVSDRTPDPFDDDPVPATPNKVEPPKEPAETPTVEFTGTPSGGTSFRPGEFDSSYHSDSEIVSAGAKHLIQAIETAKVFRALQKDVTALKKRIIDAGSNAGGAYLNLTDIDRSFEQVRIWIKDATFECNCPVCKNELKKTCPRCAGRGFLSHVQAGTLTGPETAWLASQDNKKKTA